MEPIFLEYRSNDPTIMIIGIVIALLGLLSLLWTLVVLRKKKNLITLTIAVLSCACFATGVRMAANAMNHWHKEGIYEIHEGKPP